MEERLKYLKKYFNNDVDFVHGAVKEKEINEKMQKFKDGQTKIMLCTTVVEVGIDI